MKRLAPCLAAALLCAACVPYPGQMPEGEAPSGGAGAGATSITNAPFAPLDAGASEVDSLHFAMHAYGENTANQLSAEAESDYNNIMMDTNLYSFMPEHGLYQIYVYGTQDEYLKKTEQPSWSGGVAVGNAIYSFMGPELTQTLAHEMTHVIFYEYMRYPGGQLNPQHRWVNEGLAVYEQEKAASGGQGLLDVFAGIRPTMVQQPIPMDQMINLAPATEQARTVSVWYCEAESLIQFMIEHGGRMGFSQFLAGLQKGQSFDQAIGAAFPGVWGNLSQLYTSWRTTLQQ